MSRWEMCIDRSNDRASSICDTFIGVCGLQSGTLGGVHGSFAVGGNMRSGRVVVDDVLVVVDFGVGYWAACLGVCGMAGVSTMKLLGLFVVIDE